MAGGESASSKGTLKGSSQEEPKAEQSAGYVAETPAGHRVLGAFTGNSPRKPFDISICDSEVLRASSSSAKSMSQETRCITPSVPRKKMPGTQMMLVHAEVPRWTQSRESASASSTAPPELTRSEQTLLRAATSPGSIRWSTAGEVAAASSVLKSRFLARRKRMAARGSLRRKAPLPMDAEERPLSTASAEEKLAPRRAANKVSRRKDSDEDQPTGSQVDCAGLTLKEWFDAADSGDRIGSGCSTTPSHQASCNLGPGSTSSDGERLGPLMDSTPHLNELKREAVRRALVRSVGGPLEAFRFIDINRSNTIGMTEFTDGIQRMGIDWQELTGLSSLKDLFKLFDKNGNQSLTLEELFPNVTLQVEEDPQRLNTPEFWNHWCRRTGGDGRLRSPKWAPSSPDEELMMMCRTADQRQEVADERRRMAAMIRRLKMQGKSDARCRECVAKHLPRGSGPKDRDRVETFSAMEARACRRAYNDPIISDVRNIQKTLYDMRETRRQLSTSRQKLWSVTMEPVMRAKKEEENKHALGGCLNFGSSSGSEREKSREKLNNIRASIGS